MDVPSTASTSTLPDRAGMEIVYDGECPLCSRFATMTRLRASVGDVVLRDARDDADPVVTALWREGYDLNEGMAVIYGGFVHHGADAMQMIYSCSSPYGSLNRIAAWWFRSATRARISYPILRFGRNTLLQLLRRRKITPPVT